MHDKMSDMLNVRQMRILSGMTYGQDYAASFLDEILGKDTIQEATPLESQYQFACKQCFQV